MKVFFYRSQDDSSLSSIFAILINGEIITLFQANDGYTQRISSLLAHWLDHVANLSQDKKEFLSLQFKAMNHDNPAHNYGHTCKQQTVYDRGPHYHVHFAMDLSIRMLEIIVEGMTRLEIDYDLRQSFYDKVKAQNEMTTAEVEKEILPYLVALYHNTLYSLIDHTIVPLVNYILPQFNPQRPIEPRSPFDGINNIHYLSQTDKSNLLLQYEAFTTGSYRNGSKYNYLFNSEEVHCKMANIQDFSLYPQQQREFKIHQNYIDHHDQYIDNLQINDNIKSTIHPLATGTLFVLCLAKGLNWLRNIRKYTNDNSAANTLTTTTKKSITRF